MTKFKLIQALIVVLIVCKNEEDLFKIESTRVVTTLSHYKSMGIFPNTQGQVTHVPGQILLSFKPIRDIIGLLVTCKNEEDPIKNEGARVVSTLFINF